MDIFRGRPERGTRQPIRGTPVGTPSATYRLQLNHTFTLEDVKGIIGYLDRLGVSHLYLSPLLRAKRGSLHCYDVVQHDELNPEIGSMKELESLSQELARRGMGIVLDIVPNHMFAGDENRLWMEVLEHGPFSPHADYFDIRWPGDGKVVLPILGEEYEDALASGNLELQYDQKAAASFSVVVRHGSRVPLTPRSYARILELLRSYRFRSETRDELADIHEGLKRMPGPGTHRPAGDKDMVAAGLELRRRLKSLCEIDPRVRDSIDEALVMINDVRGAPEDVLASLLDGQFYRLTYWRNANREINYRRFLNLNDFVAVRAEEGPVFWESHRLILDLVSRGVVTGLRVDHPDGLSDPAQYFRRLATSVRGRTSAARREGVAERSVYVVAEKILRKGERLADDWQVDGTTGYEFLALLNGLFVLRESAQEFDAIYSGFVGEELRFEDICYTARKQVIETSMLSDLRYVAMLLGDLSKETPRYRDLSLKSLERALTEVAACLPVYRTYARPRRSRLSGPESRSVAAAVSEAKERTRNDREVDPRALDLVREVLTRRSPGLEKVGGRHLAFAMRFQQFTPAVTVKGDEDTAFYRYNRLASLNEVGGEPGEFGATVEQFHSANEFRARHWPTSMLATSTHDTKRSEDVRARIDVLSEVPSEWRSALSRWGPLNGDKKSTVDGRPAPSRGDEYLLYQTLLGAWPFDERELPEFTDRIVANMLKAAREAKEHTSWTSPRKEYEDALEGFVRSVLQDGSFLHDFFAFERKVASLGMLNSLSQLLLKLTSPGVPDTYQGTAVWDLSLVDPDNRRPVDFQGRSAMLDALERGLSKAGTKGRAGFVSGLIAHPEDGLVKMFVLSRTLAYRRQHADLFRSGGYAPVACVGPRKVHVCAFSRTSEGKSALVIAPRFFAVLGAERWPLADPERVWDGTKLVVKKGRYSDLFTGEKVGTTVEGDAHVIELHDVLRKFPVALLLEDGPGNR